MAAGFEGIDSNFERDSMGKMLSKTSHGIEKSFMKDSESMWQTLLFFYFKKLSQQLQHLATTTLISQ